jgi:hypothetical protein
LYRDCIDIWNPVEWVGEKIVLSPQGTVVSFLDTERPAQIMHIDKDRDIDVLRDHLPELAEIAVDLTERESIAEEAIRLLGMLGGQKIAGKLHDIESSSLPSGRRKAAKEALHISLHAGCGGLRNE